MKSILFIWAYNALNLTKKSKNFQLQKKTQFCFQILVKELYLQSEVGLFQRKNTWKRILTCSEQLIGQKRKFAVVRGNF